MIQRDTFDELIKGLEPFDRRLVHILDKLRTRHHRTAVETSRFELCHLLGLEYSPEHAACIDESLARLKATPLHLSGPQSGFSLTTRALTAIQEEAGSEKLTLVLGKLFTL